MDQEAVLDDREAIWDDREAMLDDREAMCVPSNYLVTSENDFRFSEAVTIMSILNKLITNAVISKQEILLSTFVEEI